MGADADAVTFRFTEDGTYGTTSASDISSVSTVAVSSVDNSYNDAVEDLSVFNAGQFIFVSGFTDSSNNGFKTVISAVAAKVVVEETLVTEALGDTVSLLSAMRELEVVSDGLQQETDTQESDTLRDDAQVRDVVRTSIRAVGDLGIELIYDGYDSFIPAGIKSAGWSSAVTATGVTFSAASGDNSLNDSGASYLHTASLAITGNDTITRDGGSWITDGVRVNMIITITNAEDGGNDGTHIVTAVSALILTIGAAGLIDNAADTTMDIANSGGFVTDGYVAGQWIKPSGFTETDNNAVFKISTVVAAKMVLTHGTLTTESEGDSVTILMGPQATNGVAGRFFSIEKEYTQNSSDFGILVGLGINEMTIDIDAESIITGTFSFIGKSESSASSSAVNGTSGAASTDPVMNAIDDIDGIFENASSTDMISASFTVNNNLRARPEIANLGPTSLGIGKTSVSGTIRLYYESSTIMDKYLNFTSSTLVIKATDGNGNSYVYEFPEIKYTDGKRLATGRDSDVIADMTFIGVRDTTDDITIRIAKFSA